MSVKTADVVHGQSELDSHADTIALGKNSIILSYTGRQCEVSPYADTYDSIKAVPIVTGATGYTSPVTGQRSILVFNEALWLGDQMQNTLINPNQLRYYGLLVKDDPYAINEPMRIESENGDVILPLHSNGTVIYLDTWTPTDQDLQQLPHITMSSPHPWNPRDVKFPKTSRRVQEEMELRSVAISSVSTASQFDTDEPSDDDRTLLDIGDMSSRMISSVRVLEAPTSEQVRLSKMKRMEVSDHDFAGISAKTDDGDELFAPLTFQSSQRHSTVDAATLSDRWCISVAQAALTLKATTQKYKRSALLPLARRYRVDRMFGKRTFNSHVYTDTMDARVKSINGNRYGQVFATKEFFIDVFPMKSKKNCGEAFGQFITDYGVPLKMTFDGSKEQTMPGTEFMKKVRKYDVDYHISEVNRSNQNPGEGVIRELRKKWFRMVFKKKIPRQLWDYGYRYCCKIMQNTASYSGQLDGKTPIQYITGEIPEIGELLDFGMYDRCWYRENAGLGETKLGRWLGVSEKVGPLMSYWVLTSKGTVTSRTTVQRVTHLETQTGDNKDRFQKFDADIAALYKDELIIDGAKPDIKAWSEIIGDDPDFEEEFQKLISDKDVVEADDDFTPDSYDTYVNMELTLARGAETPAYARVTKRLRDAQGRPIGTANDNPILDTRMYEVEYLDGHTASLTANSIAENMFAQVDEEGNRHVMFDEIIEHRCDGKEVKLADAFLTNSKGVKRRRTTTKGWELLFKWKDGSTTWVACKDAKAAYPVQLAEYSVENQISLEPAFAWWVPHTLKKRNRILAKLKSKYWVRTHKYGIEIPKSVEQAKTLDEKNGNTLWWDSIMKEMKNVRPAFEEWEGSASEIDSAYQEIKCHMIFDIKIGENFRRKARLVAGGHTTETPAALTYASVVSRDSVRIALTIAALNDLQVLACDIQNAYLTAKCREKIWTVAGPEFGSEKGKIFIVRMALYGLKSSGAAFRSLLAETLHELEYVPSKADPDVWMRPAVKTNGFEYYEYVLCYVDDVLCISGKPEETMDGIRSRFTLKDDKVSEPEDYLGAQISKMLARDGSGRKFWTMSSEKYCKAAVTNVEERLARAGKRLPSKCRTPMTSSYAPEMEVSAELKADGVQYYQELIGVLRWACEIGRVDILLEVSLLSTYLASPRIGHLEQVFHIFGYLKEHPKRKLGFDPQHPKIDTGRFHKFDWEDFYKGAEEAIPENMPKPRGHAMSTHCFVDANHAGNKVTRRSQTGILIFCNMAPIVWHAKRQNTVETSTFGSEFTALKNAVELVEALRYKLRMFGIPIEGPTNVFCDNESVYKNVSTPESVLKKKHHSIAYHRCREAVAAGTLRIAKEPTATNLADLFTKLLPQVVRERLLDWFTY